MNTSSIPGAADSAVPTAAFPIPSSPTPVTPDQSPDQSPDHSIVPASEKPDAQPADAPAPTRVTATAIASQASPPATSLPQSIGLQERQRVVLQALTAGNSVQIAAQLAGIHPASIYRWKKYDARFIAALNAWRAQTQRSGHDTLQAAVGHAAENVLRATQKGDVRTSLALLKGLGTLAPQRPGSSQPAVVARELAAEAGLIRQTSSPRPRKVSLHLLETVFQNMEMPEAARAAYREAFALHRASLQNAATTPPPLLRPVTPEVIKQAVLAMQPTPGRAFKYVAEPSLAEYKKYQDHLREQEEASAPAEPETPPVPAYLQPLPPKPVFPPEHCKVTITAVAADHSKKLYQHIRDAEGYRAKDSYRLPHEIDLPIASKGVESYARELESMGATVEIRPVYEENS